MIINKQTLQTDTCCPLCQSKENEHWAAVRDVEYQTTDKTYNYFKCKNCDVLFINPVPENELDIIYPGNYYSFVTQQKSLTNSIKEWLDSRAFKKILNRIEGQEINILDVGGGTGWLLNIIKKLDPRIKTTQIVDIDKMAESAAKRNGHQYFCGTIESFETDIRYDLILMLNLIEHVKSPSLVLEKTHNLLTEKGRILIKTPNFNSLDARVFRHRNWGGYHCPRHWVLFNQQSFESLANRAGLKVLSAKYTQGAPFWSISVMSWLNDKKIIKITSQKPMPYHFLYGFFNALFAAFDFLRLGLSKTSQILFILGCTK